MNRGRTIRQKEKRVGVLREVCWVFAGCGMGGVMRYWMSGLVYQIFGRALPWGILFVNVTGSFIMGLLFILVFAKWSHTDFYKSFILIGFLGGYTTFSSFSIDTLNMMESGHVGGALLNVLLSVVFTLLAVWMGALLGRIWVA